VKNQKDEELEKGFKELAVGAAMAGSLASASIAPEQHQPQIQHMSPRVELQGDLKHIAMIESSGGKNKAHALTTVGVNAGHTAAGSTGLMPIMARETIRKNPALMAKYGHLLNSSADATTSFLNENPNSEAEIANSHWNRLNRIFGSNHAKKAYAWRNGISAAKNATPDQIALHPYVQKFMELKGKESAPTAVAKSEQLEKMSRPAIKFPNFPKSGVRNDQEVQPIENTRQKEIYGHKVANASLAGREVSGKMRVAGTRTVVSDKQGLTEAYSKKIAGRFDRRTLGLSADTKHGPKSAAIQGALRSKYEENTGGDEYAAKLAAHKEKRQAIITGHNQKVRDWRSKATELSQNINQPGGREEYDAHYATRIEKPKLPRAPSKPKVATKGLSVEQQADRGRATDATVHHEAFHHTMANFEKHYGKEAAKRVHTGLLAQHNPDTLASVGGFISQKLGYKTKDPKFTEEILAHSRDILTNPAKRKKYKEYAGKDADQHIKNLKEGHQKAYEYAKKLKPEDLGKTATIGHSAGLLAPTQLTGAAALVGEVMNKVKKKFRKKKLIETTEMEKAIADLEEVEEALKKS